MAKASLVIFSLQLYLYRYTACFTGLNMTIIQWEISKKQNAWMHIKTYKSSTSQFGFFGVKSPSEWPNQLSNFLSYNETFLYSWTRKLQLSASFPFQWLSEASVPLRGSTSLHVCGFKMTMKSTYECSEVDECRSLAFSSAKKQTQFSTSLETFCLQN